MYEMKKRNPQPYRCRDCNSFFSVRTGTVMSNSMSQLEEMAQGLFTSERCELDDLLDEAINEDPNLD